MSDSSSFRLLIGTCILGWVGLVVLAGILIKSVDYGNGTDQWNVSVTHVVKLVTVCYKYNT